MSWREQASPIIAETVERVGCDDQKALRLALRDAYPFGERAGHAYMAWREKIRTQLGGQFMRGDRTAEKAGQTDMCKQA